MDWLTDPQIWIALATLTFLEIVLGVDNIIFISILAGKLPPEQQPRARRLGLLGAMLTRIAAAVLARLDHPADRAAVHGARPRDLGTRPDPDPAAACSCSARAPSRSTTSSKGRRGTPRGRVAASFASVIVQIMLLDIVFSLDSVITAVGMVDELWVMIAAVIVVGRRSCWSSAEPISAFVDRHPTVKMLALSFLLLIGMSLLPRASVSTFRRATSTSRWGSRCSSRCSTCGCGGRSSRST